MLGKYDCPEFNTLVKGKPRFIVNPKKFDKDDPSKGIHLRLKSGYQIAAEHHHISRLRKTISDYLLDLYRVSDELQIEHLITSLQKYCTKADKQIRLKHKGSKEVINTPEFEAQYPQQFHHIRSMIDARNDAIVLYRSVTNSKDFKKLLPNPINFKVRFSTQELLVILGTMIQKDVLQVLEGKRPMRKQEIVKLLADYVGVLKNSGNEEIERSKSWDSITRSGISTYTGLEAYKEHFNNDFIVDFNEIWSDSQDDILGALLNALRKYSPTKKGD